MYIMSSVFGPDLYLWVIAWLWYKEASHRRPVKGRELRDWSCWRKLWSLALEKKQVSIQLWSGVLFKNLDKDWALEL